MCYQVVNKCIMYTEIKQTLYFMESYENNMNRGKF